MRIRRALGPSEDFGTPRKSTSKLRQRRWSCQGKAVLIQFKDRAGTGGEAGEDLERKDFPFSLYFYVCNRLEVAGWSGERAGC